MSKLSVNGFAPKKARSSLTKFSYELPPCKSEEVIIKITHCGICYSDIHLIDNDWGISNYPFIPGHEVIGVIEEIGRGVKKFKQSCQNIRTYEKKFLYLYINNHKKIKNGILYS